MEQSSSVERTFITLKLGPDNQKDDFMKALRARGFEEIAMKPNFSFDNAAHVQALDEGPSSSNGYF